MRMADIAHELMSLASAGKQEVLVDYRAGGERRSGLCRRLAPTPRRTGRRFDLACGL